MKVGDDDDDHDGDGDDDDHDDDPTPSTLVPSPASSIQEARGKEYGPLLFCLLAPDSVLLQRA